MLHIPTLMLALMLGFLLLALGLRAAQRSLQGRPEISRWTLGCWVMLAGLVAMAARRNLPLAIAVLLGNGLICLAFALYAQAIAMLLGRAAARWWLQVQPLIWLVLLVLLGWPPHQRSAVASLIYAALLAPSAWLILRHGWQAERSLRIVGLAFCVALLAMLVRAGHAWITPGDYLELLQPSLGQTLSFLVSFVCLLGAGFGFVLAVFERVALQLQVMATQDGLTGCSNRSTTDVLLAHELERARRSRLPLAFALMDLDHFKQVNDQHGHAAGDAVLKAFADAVRRRLRGSDVFGRLGGEEFGLVLPDTDAAGASGLAEAIRLEVAALEVTVGRAQVVKITVSAGVAVAPPDSSLPGDRLYSQADQALYEAKRAGRNRVEVYGLGLATSAPLPL